MAKRKGESRKKLIYSDLKHMLPSQNHRAYRFPLYFHNYIRNNNILGFDVSVKDSLTVKVKHSFKDISDNGQDLFFLEDVIFFH